MVSADTRSVIDRAKQIYAERLQAVLEASHRGWFVAIEPDSGDYFLADTLDGAVRAARATHPARLSHTVRVGHPATLHLGGAGLPQCSAAAKATRRAGNCSAGPVVVPWELGTGQVIGETDAHGARAKGKAYTPANALATPYGRLGSTQR